jgi:hypothetical protein
MHEIALLIAVFIDERRFAVQIARGEDSEY